MIKVNIKPLSVNDAWKGKRFKTKEYSIYEKNVLFLLPKITIGAAPYCLSIDFYFSSEASDIDNPLKPFIDVLQKKYGINDKQINKLIVEKFKVKKGSECICFRIDSMWTQNEIIK